jgi:hypothetical protein
VRKRGFDARQREEKDEKNKQKQQHIWLTGFVSVFYIWLTGLVTK